MYNALSKTTFSHIILDHCHWLGVWSEKICQQCWADDWDVAQQLLDCLLGGGGTPGDGSHLPLLLCQGGAFYQLLYSSEIIVCSGSLSNMGQLSIQCGLMSLDSWYQHLPWCGFLDMPATTCTRQEGHLKRLIQLIPNVQTCFIICVAETVERCDPWHQIQQMQTCKQSKWSLHDEWIQCKISQEPGILSFSTNRQKTVKCTKWYIMKTAKH